MIKIIICFPMLQNSRFTFLRTNVSLNKLGFCCQRSSTRGGWIFNLEKKDFAFIGRFDIVTLLTFAEQHERESVVTKYTIFVYLWLPLVTFGYIWLPLVTFVYLWLPRVHKSPHKFMLTSYMKYFAKFLAILLHNTSFFHFYFIFHTS